MHQDITDEEDEHSWLVPGQWKQSVNSWYMEEATSGNRDANMPKKQRLHLQHYCKLPVGTTAWQNDII